MLPSMSIFILISPSINSIKSNLVILYLSFIISINICNFVPYMAIQPLYVTYSHSMDT